MTSVTVLETFVSLTVQVTLLICLAAWVVQRQDVCSGVDWCWATLHTCILALTVAAFLPHLRLITWADVYPASNSPTVDAACAVLGRICGWTWISGSLAVVAVCVGGMIRATALVRDAVTAEDLSRRLLESGPALGTVKRPVELRLSQDCVSPFCWQLHRPVIALPDLVLEFPAAEQAAIVRHELARPPPCSIRCTCSCSGWSRWFIGITRWCGGRRGKRPRPESSAATGRPSILAARWPIICAVCCDSSNRR